MSIRVNDKRKKRFVADLRADNQGVKHFATVKEARAHVARVKAEIARRGDWTDPTKTPTVEEAIIQYIDDEDARSRRGEMGIAHVDNKRVALLKLSNLYYDGKKLKSMRVGDLRAGVIKRDIVRQLFENGAHKTAVNKFNIFKHFCAWLVEIDVLVVNPAIVKMPRKPAAQKQPIDRIGEQDLRRIIKCADKEFQLAIKFAAFTGLRAGEQKVLTWNDIDFDEYLVNVNKAYKKEEGVGNTKTYRSNRQIEIDALVDDLREWKLAQPIEQRRLNLIFPNQSGGYASTDRWRKIGLHQACDRAEAARIRWHDLRHFFASLLIFKLRETDAVVTRLMGHHSIAFTEKQYGHWLPEARKDRKLGKRIAQAASGGEYNE